MDLTVEFNVGVGPVKLGMTMDQVRAAIARPHESFMKSRTSTMPTDDFYEEGIQVYYKKPGICNAIEMGSPAKPVIHGNEIIGVRISEVREWLLRLDRNLETDGDGLTSHALGIGCYAPNAGRNPSARVESLIIFENGYYKK